MYNVGVTHQLEPERVHQAVQLIGVHASHVGGHVVIAPPRARHHVLLLAHIGGY